MKRLLSLVACSASIAAVGCQSDGSDRTSGRDSGASVASTRDVDSLTRGWPQVSRQAAQKMVEKYGPPDEATETMLVWHNNGEWGKTVVFNEEVEHNFPMPHKDVLEQTIAYDAPPETYDELAMFDGSVVVDRTQGKMSARCDKEEANFLAINLAHEVASGRRSVEDARAYVARALREFMQTGEKDPYMQGLQFQPVAEARAGDPDRRVSVLAGAEMDR